MLNEIETIREQGLNADLYRGHVRAWNASKMTEQQYQYVGDNLSAIATLLVAEDADTGTPDPYGLKMKNFETRAVINDDYYLWLVPNAVLSTAGNPDRDWRTEIDKANGRPFDPLR
jgi:hypothetical protein